MQTDAELGIPSPNDRVDNSKEEPDESSAWYKLDKLVRQHDERMVKDFKEEMDSILVFAGLFSAVVATFFVDSYKRLQPDPQGASNYLLMQIVLQLNKSALNESMISQFQLPEHDSSAWFLNTCWSLSLVLSLSIAALGMCIKQWLRVYMVFPSVPPRERLRIRHYRYRGLQMYGVTFLADRLSSVLVIALMLFLSGFTTFLSSIDSSFAGGTQAVILVIVAIFQVITIAPVLHAQCPYKSPILSRMTQSIWDVILKRQAPEDSAQKDDGQDVLILQFLRRELRHDVQDILRDCYQDVSCLSLHHWTLYNYKAREPRVVGHSIASCIAALHADLKSIGRLVVSKDFTCAFDFLTRHIREAPDAQLGDLLQSLLIQEDSDIINQVAWFFYFPYSLHEHPSSNMSFLLQLRGQVNMLTDETAFSSLISHCDRATRSGDPESIAGHLLILLFFLAHSQKDIRASMIPAVNRLLPNFAEHFPTASAVPLLAEFASQCLMLIRELHDDHPDLNSVKLIAQLQSSQCSITAQALPPGQTTGHRRRARSV